MLEILIVKTSSMGDVIHQLPAVTDLRLHFPDARIDWVAEESFADIPALHPGVDEVIPAAVRRWRRTLSSRAAWQEMRAFQTRLQARDYDVVMDSQGLIKSAVIARLARGARCGFDRASAREPLAALAYDKAFPVPRQLHAVERNRMLAGLAFGYEPDTPPDYGVAAPALDLPWLPRAPYVVLLHATSRADKEWPQADWLALADWCNGAGLACVLPWGSEPERERSESLAGQMGLAVVPPRLSLRQAAAMLAASRAAVGVDTGLTHLAAALKTPVAAIYCASDPGLTGVYASTPHTNLGGVGLPPAADEVIAALAELIPA